MTRQIIMEVAGEVFPAWINDDEMKTTDELQIRTVAMEFTIRPVDYERAHNAIAIANREALPITMRSPKQEEICENPQKS